MQRYLTTFFVLLIYFTNISTSITIIQDQCSCSCCIGFGCTPIQKPDFLIPWCTDNDDACVLLCKTIFPIDCNDIDSQTFAVCLSGTVKTSDRYIILTLLGLIFVILIHLTYQIELFQQ